MARLRSRPLRQLPTPTIRRSERARAGATLADGARNPCAGRLHLPSNEASRRTARFELGGAVQSREAGGTCYNRAAKRFASLMRLSRRNSFLALASFSGAF